MTSLTPLKLEDGTLIYLEAAAMQTAPSLPPLAPLSPTAQAVLAQSGAPSSVGITEEEEAPGRVGKGWLGLSGNRHGNSNGSANGNGSSNGNGNNGSVATAATAATMAPSLQPSEFQALETTIRTYTHHTLNAFRKLAIANVDKVTLEFGVQISGEMGIPYVTKGSAESNIRITVECSFEPEA